MERRRATVTRTETRAMGRTDARWTLLALALALTTPACGPDGP